jgi:hypothetical protein
MYKDIHKYVRDNQCWVRLEEWVPRDSGKWKTQTGQQRRAQSLIQQTFELLLYAMHY